MLITHIKPNGKGWDVVVGRTKVASIRHTRKNYVAAFTRPVPLAVMEAVCGFVAHGMAK